MKSIKNNAVVLRFHRQLQVTKVMSKVLAWLRESVVGGLNVMNDPKCNKVQSPYTYRWSQKNLRVKIFHNSNDIEKSIVVQKRAYLSNDIMDNLVYEKPIQFVSIKYYTT